MAGKPKYYNQTTKKKYVTFRNALKYMNPDDKVSPIGWEIAQFEPPKPMKKLKVF